MSATRKDIIRIISVTLVTGVFAGCGGGGGGSAAVAVSSRTPGPDVAVKESLRLVKPASFSDEDAVVILAPGSIMDDTMLPLTRMAIALDLGLGVDATGADLAINSTACPQGGSYEVTSYQQEDVNSPYNGGNFDVVTSESTNCQESVSIPEVNPGIVNGYKKVGYPVSGIGSGKFATETHFIGYERSGKSLQEPFIGTGVLFGIINQARIWDGHMMLKRENTETDLYGDAGGAVTLYSVISESAAFEGDSSLTLRQMGDSDNKLWLEYDPISELGVNEGHIERYEGMYGEELLSIQGNDVPESCPQGRFHVKTLADLYFGVEEEYPKYIDESYRIVTGSLQMLDDTGNEAVVEYDGMSETITVTLNEGIPKIYSLDDVAALRFERCLKEPMGL